MQWLFIEEFESFLRPRNFECKDWSMQMQREIDEDQSSRQNDRKHEQRMTSESVWHLKVQPWCSSIQNKVKYTRWAAFRSLSVSDTVIRQLIEIVSIEARIQTNNARPTKGKRRRREGMRSSMTRTFLSTSLFPENNAHSLQMRRRRRWRRCNW